MSSSLAQAPVFLLPEPGGYIGWSWSLEEDRSSTQFLVAPGGGLGTESLVPEFSADGGGSWHRNLTDCAFSDIQNLQVAFSKVSPAESGSSAVQTLESAVKFDQTRNSISFQLDHT